MLRNKFAAFAPGAELAKIPLWNVIMNSVDCIYIERGADDEGRKRAL